MVDVDWSLLNRLQLGRYAEYLVSMEFTRSGLAKEHWPALDQFRFDRCLPRLSSKMGRA